jgi:hypothetical protein
MNDKTVTMQDFTTTRRQLIYLIYYCMIMCNGWIELGTPLLWQLVDRGVLHIADNQQLTNKRSVSRICFNEPVMERTIKEVIFSLVSFILFNQLLGIE